MCIRDSNAGAALLEPLGVGIHAIDLAKIRVANSVAIIGAGAIGLYILQLARLSGADPIFISDKLDWRLDYAKKYGAITINCDKEDPVEIVQKATNGRGVDIAVEAAWGDSSVQQAAEMTRLGGKLILVGIPGSDQMTLKHSTLRRRGLTICMARRSKHTYPRAIELATSKIKEAGANSVILKLGENGCYVDCEGIHGHFLAPKVNAVNTAGAGDVFAGALSVAISEGMDISDSIDFANNAAALSVTKDGIQESMPTRVELDRWRY